MAHEPEPISPEPEPRDGKVIPMPVGLGYRPAATPGAPRLSPPADLDADQGTDQAIPGEAVEVEPVDQPAVAADTGSWIDQRRAYLEEAPDIIPPYLRSAEEFAQVARWVAAYYAHVMAFHATRLPIYLLRLVARSPDRKSVV